MCDPGEEVAGKTALYGALSLRSRILFCGASGHNDGTVLGNDGRG